MRTFSAKILDTTHLEPINHQPGERVQIAISDERSDERTWRRAAAGKLLASYADRDSIYDDL
jgi:hypothetical protein